MGDGRNAAGRRSLRTVRAVRRRRDVNEFDECAVGVVLYGELRSIESAEHLVHRRPRRTRTKHAQELSTEWHSVRKLIAPVPTP